MNNFKNLKIAITDETHLKAVCEVLESMDYTECGYDLDCNNIVARSHGVFFGDKYDDWDFDQVTLSDLLKIRDEMVKANAKSS